MRLEKLYESAKNNPVDVRFGDLCKLIEAFGFRYRGGKGSHQVYVKEGVLEILNVQSVRGRANPYQVRQFLKVVENYKLILGGLK